MFEVKQPHYISGKCVGVGGRCAASPLRALPLPFHSGLLATGFCFGGCPVWACLCLRMSLLAGRQHLNDTLDTHSQWMS